MADKFLATIVSEMSGLGFSATAQESPTIRQTEGGLRPSPPAVLVVPKNQDDVKYHAMDVDGVHVNVRSTYDVFFVTLNQGANVPDDAHDSFVTLTIPAFMPMPSAIASAGAWQSRAVPVRDVDRGLFSKNYTVSQVSLAIDWIM